ncbi:nicotinamide-nucleotide amidase [secondary endosymbiont of Ctenarytaina eucalypti]|uniref:nicotinamide-nucleotide amidase n=1 Tax=secondary endosymbiont of Ctenarytaina eucalypti TaxID=1199245 RepID=UPI001357620B|nr:nicotinamide-nucleotide amidase [secondary endosymbiont of Ctenarytaina eucalypti]
MHNNELYALSVLLGTTLKREKKWITCAESCTGGWVAKMITDVAGSSNWFKCGFVTYSNQAKIDLLNVRHGTIEQHGAVSDAVVKEMACGALRAASADYAVAISGIAGPDGGTVEKPVGMVWFGFALAEGALFSQLMHLEGDRNSVRRQAVHLALGMLFATSSEHALCPAL